MAEKNFIAYALVHLDVATEEVLSSAVVGNSLIRALAMLKNHPCTLGALYEFDDRVGFDHHCLSKYKCVVKKGKQE